ncbi:hypothetical protein TrCOL_g441 [Triparma columacea]|uniref:Protein kinase domain-containing protein n=1 Tax=Triparma columacea TaxID=722753 RepID=A0A9W7G5R5_9STRA|nr:hypothetical protein TrCOL_g441 [Triparma columacea]
MKSVLNTSLGSVTVIDLTHKIHLLVEMKFSSMLKTGKAVLKSTVKGASLLADSGILDNIPIVSNILSGAQLINEVLEGKESADTALGEVKQTVDLVSPIVVKIGQAADATDQGLNDNLKAVNDILEELWEHIDSYVKRAKFVKYAAGESYSSEFEKDLKRLRKALDTLSFTLTGETLVTVMRTEGKVDNLAEQMQKLGATKTVQQRRDSRLSSMEIDDRNVDWFEDEPFAQGSFGAVYRVKYEGKVCAAKMVSLRDVPKSQLEATKKEYKKEVALMGELRSNNTVQILGAITRPTELVILMEYCEGGDLRGLLDKARVGEVEFDHGAVCNMLLEISYGMRYLHGRPSPVIHKDLKSNNILIDREGSGKVADFGGSQSNNMSSSRSAKGSGVGTQGWTAPEVIDEGLSALSLKADVYSFAIVMWECLTQKIPWDGKTDGQIIKAIIKEQRPPVDESMNAELKALMEQCWSEDPKDRPHFDVIVKKLEAIAPPKVRRTSSTGSASRQSEKDAQAAKELEELKASAIRQSEKDAQAARELEELKAKLAESERARAVSRAKRGELERMNSAQKSDTEEETSKKADAPAPPTLPPPPPQPRQEVASPLASPVAQGSVGASEETVRLEKAYQDAKSKRDIPLMKELKVQIEESRKLDEVEAKKAAKKQGRKNEIANLKEKLDGAIDRGDFDLAEKIQLQISELEIWKFTSNEKLKEAAEEWVEDKEKANEKYGPIEDWDVSEVTSFDRLFCWKSEFNEDLSRWDVSNVTSMENMFESCNAFNSDISTWDTSSCTNMCGMFSCCYAFNSDLSSWNTSNCTDMSCMFSSSRAFNSDLSTWNTSKCTNMYSMFESCSAFNSDISTWNTSKCTDMSFMFDGCSAFNSDLSTWNTSKCTNMSHMFCGCRAFNSDLSTWNTSNCTNMWKMFLDCSAFNSDLSTWNTSKCTNMKGMFNGASKMTKKLKPKGARGWF